MATPARRVAVVGLGPIGTRVVKALDDGIDGLVLTAISIQNPAKHLDHAKREVLAARYFDIPAAAIADAAAGLKGMKG